MDEMIIIIELKLIKHVVFIKHVVKQILENKKKITDI
jgi:hypothetical protein